MWKKWPVAPYLDSSWFVESGIKDRERMLYCLPAWCLIPDLNVIKPNFQFICYDNKTFLLDQHCYVSPDGCRPACGSPGRMGNAQILAIKADHCLRRLH